MKTGRSYIKSAAALAAVVILALIAAFSGMSATPAACAGTKAPQKAVTGFFDALCSGDMELADSYVGDYSGLGFSGDASSVLEKRLYDELISSYSYRLSGELVPQSGSRSYKQTVAFTHLDMDSVSEQLTESFPDCLEIAAREFVFDEIYDDDGGYSREVIDRGVELTLDKIFENKQDYLVTENIDVEAEYSSHKWRVAVSDRLADAILGGTGTDNSKTEA